MIPATITWTLDDGTPKLAATLRSRLPATASVRFSDHMYRLYDHKTLCVRYPEEIAEQVESVLDEILKRNHDDGTEVHPENATSMGRSRS